MGKMEKGEVNSNALDFLVPINNIGPFEEVLINPSTVDLFKRTSSLSIIGKIPLY